MIKRYFDFINENYGGFSSLAEYIEHLAKDNEYAKSVISDFTKDINPNVRIANAINSLDNHTQELILKMIQDEQSDIKPEKEVEVTPITSTRFDESQQTGGKNIFKCFLKVISALGQKDCEIDWNYVPQNYLALFITNDVDTEQMKSIMSRYLYFDNFIKSQTEISNTSKLYFGIKNDMYLDYGVMVDGRMICLGKFLLTQGTYNFIMTLDLKSATNLKKFLVGLDLSKLSILSKVKSIMKDYFPGQSDDKISPTINGDVISYGFQGLGNWDNGQMDMGELDNIKSNLRSFFMQNKWSDKIQFNVIPSDQWVFINIKFK